MNYSNTIKRAVHKTRLNHNLTVEVWIIPFYAAVIYVQHATLVIG